jgi:hypothetical protein
VTLVAPHDQGASPLEPEPAAIGLPSPRGPVSGWLLHRLQYPVHDLGPMPEPVDDPITGEDSPLALYLCYELHYLGLPDVEEAWEWDPSVLAARRILERAFERRMTDIVGYAPVGLSAADTVQAVDELAAADGGPSLSGFVRDRASLDQVRELAVHRSPYQLKEADPHTWAIPRLTGRAKAALVDIQRGEYGDGRADQVHAELFGDTMEELGLDRRYGAYLDRVPGLTLSTCNLISLFGLHRRWRGALVGHLALFEMCSVGPMGRYRAGLARLGLGDRATRFYAAHVVADERHQVVALDEMVLGLALEEPFLGGEIVHGARCLSALEALFADHVLGAWERGDTSLLVPLLS